MRLGFCRDTGILACVGFVFVLSGQITNTNPTQARMPVLQRSEIAGDFDDFMNGLLAKWRIPGAAIGVSHDGRLVLVRGYGMADVEAGQPVQPDSLFRIAGVSKAITAVAILRLVEDGKLSLDAEALPILAGSGAPAESLTNHATVRELLQTGVGQPTPPSCGAANGRDALNSAYCLLLRIVEKASGQSYESYIQSAVLAPLGIARMQLGRTALAGRAKNEVHYYDSPGAQPSSNTPRPYEAHDPTLETSGWIASVADLLRFANGLDGRRPTALLKPASLDAMLARPAATPSGASSYNGLAWVIQPAGSDSDWQSFGGLPGASAYLLRQAATGVDVAVLFNSRPADSDAFEADLSAGVKKTVNAITEWPSNDLFFEGPELFPRDVVNSADYSGGKVSPGEIVVLYPSNAGPAELAGSDVDADGRIATITGETRVLFDGFPAPMASAVRGRIGAVVPYGIAGRKTTQVEVEYQGVRSPAVTLPVVDSAPAVFTLDASGKGQAAMLNETGCCNSVRNPAARGTVAALYATGEGQTSPRGIDGDLSGHDRVADLPKPLLAVGVTVGGIPAEITYAGEAPHAVAGLLQVNFRIPANAPVGDQVPLVLTVGSGRSPEGVTMAVRSQVQRILVLDSDATIRNQLTRILKGAGYEVFSARDGREALAQASQHPLDLAICSLAIPEAERLATIRAIASERSRLRIVATVGMLDPAALKAADLLGAQAVLTKPLVAATVLGRVRELLRSRPFPYVADEEMAPSPLRLQDRRIGR